MSEPWIIGDVFLDRSALETEWLQCEDEGRDVHSLAAEFETLKQSDLVLEENQRAAELLLDRSIKLPKVSSYPYEEPSDLNGIRAQRPSEHPKLPSPPPMDSNLRDKIHGAWLGRCSGCLLGKPIECWHSDRVWPMLKSLENWPLQRYMEGTVPEDLRQRFDIAPGAWADQVDCMPEDDDLNYTVIGLEIMKSHGRDFTTADIARYWIQNLALEHTFTAERTVYRNLALMVNPDRTATFRNPYREWIGAQIRADFFGYAAPGRPEIAAEWAWRDASLTHVKNGLYGSMWVAAMLATAAVTNDVLLILESGLAQIPENCRLAHGIRDVLEWYHKGGSYEDVVQSIHSRWDEKNKHHWCHTISNAQIVAVGLLWGNGDLGTSICRAVQPCFDTDCNGATVGSIIGMTLGAKKLQDGDWTRPLKDTIITGISGHHRVSISGLADETCRRIEELWS